MKREDYVKDFPSIKGMSEIHIFLGPLNPDESTLQQYYSLVESYNATQIISNHSHLMKGVFLCLNYRNQGDVKVMQSSRYFYSSNTDEVIEECYKQGEWFRNHGFSILRHKIECIASAEGVPINDNDCLEYPNRYFEFHIRVRRKDMEGTENEEIQITDSEIDLLKDIANNFSWKFETPVPLSFNCANRGQRYLNVRFNHCGSDVARERVNEIVKAIDETEELKWVKTISEYVWYDDFRGLDNGWIDFTPDEQNEFMLSAN